MTRLLIDTPVLQKHVLDSYIGTRRWDQELAALYKVTTSRKLKCLLLVVMQNNDGGKAKKCRTMNIASI